MRRIVFVGVVTAALVSGTVFAADVRFTKEPTARRVGEKVEISFAVSAPTDVAIAVVDARGKIVRHLAAGALAKRAPEPLEPSLEQTLFWDRRDDAGEQVPPGKYSVRVGVGLKGSFDKILGWNAQNVGAGIRSLVVAPNGELYVLNRVGHLHGGNSTMSCQVFDRQGRYLRTIMPYSHTLPREKVKGFGLLELSPTRWYPFIHHGENRSFYPGLREIPRQQAVLTKDGRLLVVMIVGKGGGYTKPGRNRVFAIVADDGSVPPDGCLGPMLVENSATSNVALALDPDDQTLYATGFGAEGSLSQEPAYRGHKKDPVVYRCLLTDKRARPFIEKGLIDPVGLAVDNEGNLYVSDHAGNRINVYTLDGELLTTLKVEKPNMLAVHRKTGAIYTLVGAPPATLVKLSSIKEGKPVIEMSLGRLIDGSRRHLWPLMALDDTVEPAIVWIGTPTHYNPFVLLRIEDRGSAFAPPVEVTQPALPTIQDLSIDRDREEIYVRAGNFYRINGRTGRVEKLPIPPAEGIVVTAGADGNIYQYRWDPYPKGAVWRLNRELQPVPFAGLGTHRLRAKEVGGIHLMARGLAVARNGDIYVLSENPGRGHPPHSIHLFGPDGALKKANLVRDLSTESCSVRVDPTGNVYVASPTRPAGERLPSYYYMLGMVVKERETVWGHPNWYPVMYGSILKFSPTGGAELESMVPGANEVVKGFDQKRYLQGALWQWRGISPVPCYAEPYVYYCVCEQTRFDVDDFGRVFAPDVGRFSVRVVDTNRNPILRLGAYGNQDSRSEIRWAWPSQVAVSDEALYVADVINRRIVRIKLGYQLEAVCEIK